MEVDFYEFDGLVEILFWKVLLDKKFFVVLRLGRVLLFF